jgi:hypothetical protein
MSASNPPKTPDERYILVHGRLWRCTDPGLTEGERQHWVSRLMKARSAVGHAKRNHDPEVERQARAQVDEAKRALGERGPVWWTDGAPDYSQCKVENTPYAQWHSGLKHR